MAGRHLVKFKGDKCEVLQLGQNNPVQVGLNAKEKLWRKGPGHPGDSLEVTRCPEQH